MASTPPRPQKPDRKPDNVVRFERRTPRDAAPPPARFDWRRALAGREGLVGFALILLLAIALVAFNRLGGQ